jgi:hypothetical protein
MNCILCNRELEHAVPETVRSRSDYQPYAGGEIRLQFCFGSCKFDLAPGFTEFRGVICDDCAAPLTKKMKQSLYGFDGKPWNEEIQAKLNEEIFRELGNTVDD